MLHGNSSSRDFRASGTQSEESVLIWSSRSPVLSLLIHAACQNAAIHRQNDSRSQSWLRRRPERRPLPPVLRVLRSGSSGCASELHRPRPVPTRSFSLRGVRKYPGAMALTQMPCFAHSIASDLVSDASPDLLALYAATSNRAKKRAHRSDVDDSAVAPLDHVPAEDLAGSQCSRQVGLEDAVPVFFR